jgi:hypothetical protein
MTRVARKTRWTGFLFGFLGLVLAYHSKTAHDPKMWRLAAILALAIGGGLLLFAMMRRSVHARLTQQGDRPPHPPS